MAPQVKFYEKVSLEKVVIVSFLTNISDVLVNTIIALITGSVTTFSQAIEGLADLIASGLLLVGFRKSRRPADKKHPFGYGRELYFWSFLSGLIIFMLTASFSFYWGLERFLNPHPVRHIWLSFGALLLGLVTNGYAFSLSYQRLLGKKNPSRLWHIFLHSALIETKTAFVLDLMGTVASAIGLIALSIYWLFDDNRFDGIGAMTVGVILAFFAVFILKGAKDLLVGQSADAETEQKIRETVVTVSEVKKVLSLRTLVFGPSTMLINLELHIKDGLTTDEIEKLTDEIEHRIREQIPSATNIQVELETPDVEFV